MRGHFAAFVAALVVFLVGLWLQITACDRIVAAANDEIATENYRTGRPEFAGRVGAALSDVQLDVLEVTAWVLLATGTNGLHGWALFCQQVGGPVIVAGAIATGVTFALARRVFLVSP